MFVTWAKFSSVQSLIRIRLFATPWIAARQASLSITNPRSSLRLMSIESVMPSSHLILCCSFLLLPLILPSIRVLSNESNLHMSIAVSASAPVLPMNTQDWSPLGWTGWISLQSKGLSRVFSNTTVQKHQFFGAQLSSQSNSHIHIVAKLLSRFRLFATPWTRAYQAPQSVEFCRQEYWSGLPFPSPGIFPTQGSNRGLPHCRQTLYCLSQQGSLYRCL